jgi:hypothetical protein
VQKQEQDSVAGRIGGQVPLPAKGRREGQQRRLEAKGIELGQEAAEVADALLVYRGSVQIRGKVPQIHEKGGCRYRRGDPWKRYKRRGRAHRLASSL